MNCPHGWTKVDEGTECAACFHDREIESIARGLEIVRDLAACDHPAPSIVHVESGTLSVRWCDRCGALDLSGTGRGHVGSALSGRARKLVLE